MTQTKMDKLNKDVIVYCAMDSGIDGREKPKVMYASLSADDLQTRIANDPNKAWRTVEKRIVNLAFTRIQALGKLDGVEKLALNLLPGR